jgi:sugar phosphate isomerase/epimerase
MNVSNIVINTLVFLDDMQNGIGQAKLLNNIHGLGIQKAEIRREFIKDFTNELLDIGTTAEKLQIELFYSVPDYLYVNCELAVEKIARYFIEANKMNCKNVKLNIGDFNTITTQDVISVNSLCDKYSIKLTVENDQTKDNGRINKIIDFMQLAKKLGMHISCTFDVGNWMWQNEDPEDNARRLKPYVTYIHLKDVLLRDKPQAVFLDNGILPWRDILRIFEKNIPIAIEYPCNPDTQLRLSKEISKLVSVY